MESLCVRKWLCPDFRAFIRVSRPSNFKRKTRPFCVQFLRLDITAFGLEPHSGMHRSQGSIVYYGQYSHYNSDAQLIELTCIFRITNWPDHILNYLSSLNCSDPSWGGRNYILKWVFFVQSILADRYIHRRELRLVSLESLSSVEYGIKKIFFWLLFFTGRYRGLNFRENSASSVDFFHLFSEFLTKISPILLKFNKNFQENVKDFIFKDKNI